MVYIAPRSQGRTLVEIEGNAHLLNWSLALCALLLIRNFVFLWFLIVSLWVIIREFCNSEIHTSRVEGVGWEKIKMSWV